ncbi:hypothetical protein V2W45_1475033 [Cenococcum geophilum]
MDNNPADGVNSPRNPNTAMPTTKNKYVSLVAPLIALSTLPPEEHLQKPSANSPLPKTATSLLLLARSLFAPPSDLQRDFNKALGGINNSTIDAARAITVGGDAAATNPTDLDADSADSLWDFNPKDIKTVVKALDTKEAYKVSIRTQKPRPRIFDLKTVKFSNPYSIDYYANFLYKIRQTFYFRKGGFLFANKRKLKGLENNTLGKRRSRAGKKTSRKPSNKNLSGTFSNALLADSNDNYNKEELDMDIAVSPAIFNIGDNNDDYLTKTYYKVIAITKRMQSGLDNAAAARMDGLEDDATKEDNDNKDLNRADDIVCMGQPTVKDLKNLAELNAREYGKIWGIILADIVGLGKTF